ncbi:hypothetical protein Tter_2158 [Thermobaculum terrenum ATCC BAA-798]|uniref:Uncharacterized protein n=1 Tax=Thermobaculum terrenum (strain ATCC BAA-798 / CCMEE 7001 / YNP1) TaxID=525904 RepID=D1CH38_THET1|nr:hypothetical protein [Thermobaculum terrenum]ACZ43059.1 hypothetical protein Tter_2158 [Thermobaculum terrenum ATCC BAA-798]
MRAWALLVIALLLLPLGGSPAVAESCGGRPPVNVARLPGVTPQGLPSVGLQPAQVRRSTCNYLMLSLKGRVEYVSGAHVLLRGPDGHLRLYDLRSRRAYALDQGPVLSPKTDGRWVVYAKYWLAEGQPLRYRWYSGLPVLARAYPGAEPNRSEIYALDLASGRRRLVASSRVPGYSTTTLPELDLSEGRLVYRIVRGDPTAPTSEVHLVELASVGIRCCAPIAGPGTCTRWRSTAAWWRGPSSRPGMLADPRPPPGCTCTTWPRAGAG